MSKVMSIKELNQTIVSPGLPRYQRRANFKYLEQVHGKLKEGGYWGWPDAGRTFQKVGTGFVEVV